MVKRKVMDFAELAKNIHQTAVEKGWWSKTRRRQRRNPGRYLTVTEVTEMMGYHRNMVYYWIKRDGLPYKRTKGGFYRIRERDLQEFMEKFYPEV